ncbi:hypothetical protein [Streptomyces malaysiensis]|uniref:Uncharacterized protein n=1 Tax=Streptomyces malaysiensis subsp. samsunensis TaxID=459658 RepID=A0A9X2RUU6_STRMQ|nr:hypothetical protein [Streptomyces samsunensis]MCQ8831821.1 hypothetical protein [Streptomyces samsunensis]
MTGTNPTDQIRAAAELLRALATAASTDETGRPTARWYFTEHGRHDSGYLYAANPTGPGARILRGGSSGPHGRGLRPHLAARHGEYIAAMDPTVGFALAAWLDSAVEDAGQVGPDPHALAVARQILDQETER